jgi:hypothetical protein
MATAVWAGCSSPSFLSNGPAVAAAALPVGLRRASQIRLLRPAPARPHARGVDPLAAVFSRGRRGDGEGCGGARATVAGPARIAFARNQGSKSAGRSTADQPLHHDCHRCEGARGHHPDRDPPGSRVGDEGLLRETTGKSWGKVYVAPGVLDALEQRATT